MPSPEQSDVENVSGRTVTVVVCDRLGTVLGALEPISLPVRWWPETGDLVQALADRDSVDLVILRLLHGEEPDVEGADIVVLAESRDDIGAGLLHEVPDRAAGGLASDPLRASWAMPGGPASDLAWASAQLSEQSIEVTGRPRQLRSWNLSSLWQLQTSNGPMILKVVPPFFAHESAVLRILGSNTPRAGLPGRRSPVPPLVAGEGPRSLMIEVPGELGWGSAEQALRRMVETLVDIQADWIGHTDDLLDLGLSDWRSSPFTRAAASLIERRGDTVTDTERARLNEFVQTLPSRFDDLASCGIPDSLVHGDMHPGNVILTSSTPPNGDVVILDWGDSGVGHPLLDTAQFLNLTQVEHRTDIVRAWDQSWRTRLPGCDPTRSRELLVPIARLRQALIYQSFLDGIAVTERVYHHKDVPNWLSLAAQGLAVGT